MKKLFLLVLICAFAVQTKAQFNFSFTDGGVPVVGSQYGIVGGLHSALLHNRDDIATPFVKMQTMNLTYFGGIEHIKWKTPHFGFGQQLLYWNAGAKYSGAVDSADGAATIDANTSLTYVKVPLLFWYKSYSRWHPDRRIRVNTFFGPYAAMAIEGKADWTVALPGTDYINSYELSSGSFTGKDKDNNELPNLSADDGTMFKTFDWGFTMGGGLEFRLWRKTVIGLTLRADLGMAEVEDKDFSVTNEAGVNYRFFQDVTSKHIPNPPIADFKSNRPETNNNSFGLQLSIRKYFGVN